MQNKTKTEINVRLLKILLLFLSIQLSAPFLSSAKPVATNSPVDPLIKALIQVESRGNDMAIGDRGKGEKAYGALQIRKPCVDDVNRRFGTKYRAEDMLGNRALSVWVCQKYIEMYATPKGLGKEPSPEDKARVWNGGPSGWKRDSTKGYWAKVSKALVKSETMLATIK